MMTPKWQNECLPYLKSGHIKPLWHYRSPCDLQTQLQSCNGDMKSDLHPHLHRCHCPHLHQDSYR